MGTSVGIVVALALATGFTGVARAEWAAAAPANAAGSTGHLALILGPAVDLPAFSCTDVMGAVVCEPEAQTVQLPIMNSGSLPGSLHLRMAVAGGPCEALTVSIGEGEPEALCELLDPPVNLGLTLDPQSSALVDVAIGVAPTAPSGTWEVSLAVELSLALWVLGGGPDSSWTETRSVPVVVTGSWSEPEEAASTDEPAAGTEAGSADSEAASITETEPPTDGDEEAVAGDPATSDESPIEGTGTEPGEEPVDEAGKTPPDDESLPDGSSSPAGDPEEDPGTGGEPPNMEPDPEEEVLDPPGEPVGEEAGVYLVSGVVWLDTDGDRLLVPGGDETGIEGLAVDLLSENGERIARVRTDRTGRYVFEDLPPGPYLVEIHVPRGLEPSVAEDGADLRVLASGIAGELGIDPCEIVVDDTIEVIVEPRRYRIRSTLLMVDGDVVDSADFALVEEPTESTSVSAKDPDQVATRPEKPGAHMAGEEVP